MHIHQYETRDHEPHNGEIVRSRLLKRPNGTFDSVEEAIAWYAQWLDKTPRPPSCWGADGEEAGKLRKLEFTRSALGHASDVVDGFWSGGGFIKLMFIPCPVRKVPGYPSDYPCPIGRG